MKATLWLCTLVTTMVFASPSIYGSPLTDYQYRDSRSLQENYLAAKRTKPSLSIVNPLDVLRQRLLLEIARRQMRENTKQVEMNREYLKTIGKRGKDLDYFDFDHNDIENDNENEINYNNKKNEKTNDDDYQVKYVYSLHKNRFSNK